MKEIKAYIRINMINKVVHALEEAGFVNMTVIDVKAIWKGLGREDLLYSIELAERYMNVAKLELVARDQDVPRIAQIIEQMARTGRSGDGLIYVCPVEDAVHIRTGLQGEQALGTPS